MGYSIPDDLKYAKSHEWVKVDGKIVTVGITDYAQHELDSIQFVEFPGIGEDIEAGEVLGAIEAVKAAEDLICPVSGKVVEINEVLEEEGSAIHKDPYGAGWLVKLECDPSLLAKELKEHMNASQYRDFIEKES